MNVTQDDYEQAKAIARGLLKRILPEPDWIDLEERGVINFRGKRGTYLISPYSQTEIRDSSNGKCMAYACMQLSIPAPTYDRMAAEYLLLRNAEETYWQTANIFTRVNDDWNLTSMLLIAFDLALFVNIVIGTLAGKTP